MRERTPLLSVGLAVSILSLPAAAARAEDAAQADPFRPVQPAWSETQAVETPRAKPPATKPPATKPPAPVTQDNEEFLFDEAQPAAAPAEVEPKPEPAPVAAEPAPVVAAPDASAPIRPAGEVDLRTPHLWMVTGGSMLGASVVAALAMAIALDDADLAGATLALGGAVGIAGLTVGVVMQNQRLSAAGHEVAPALPSGITLKLSLTR